MIIKRFIRQVIKPYPYRPQFLAIAYSQMFQPVPIVIGPSILSADFGDLHNDCVKVLECGSDSLHIDVMDMHFVPNLTIGPPVVASLRKKLPDAHFDVHLMVTHPQKYIEPLAKAKTNCMTFHIEAQYQNLHDICDKIRLANMEVGISIKPKTPVSQQLQKAIQLGKVDKVLVMTVQPGFGGQKFMEEMMPKVKQLRDKFPKLNIQVDGGITEQNIQIVVKNGANCIVSGTGIFGVADKTKTIGNMKECLRKYFQC